MFEKVISASFIERHADFNSCLVTAQPIPACDVFLNTRNIFEWLDFTMES
jgi:hypothetical protein